jgi:hypothetical protein
VRRTPRREEEEADVATDGPHTKNIMEADMTTEEAASTPLAIRKAGAVAVLETIGPGPISNAIVI